MNLCVSFFQQAVSIVTLVSLLITLPYTLTFRMIYTDSGKLGCLSSGSEAVTFFFRMYRLLFMTYGLLPSLSVLATNVALLVRIRAVLRGRQLLTQSQSSSKDDKTSSEEISASMVLVALSIIFLLSATVPVTFSTLFYIYVYLMKAQGPIVQMIINLGDIGKSIFFISQSTNWFIYMFKMKEFNDEFKQIFCGTKNPTSVLKHSTPTR